MASFQEIEAQVRQGQSVLDALRINALVDISKITGRNAIAYYSAFMTRRGDGMEINDMDLNGFMNVVCKMDRKHGLDLILHTPGGGITATVVKADAKLSGSGCRYAVELARHFEDAIRILKNNDMIKGKVYQMAEPGQYREIRI